MIKIKVIQILRKRALVMNNLIQKNHYNFHGFIGKELVTKKERDYQKNNCLNVKNISGDSLKNHYYNIK